MSHPLAKLLTGGINNDECYNGDIRYIYEAAAALTAAAERETALREEKKELIVSGMKLEVERDNLKAEVERLKGELAAKDVDLERLRQKCEWAGFSAPPDPPRADP